MEWVTAQQAPGTLHELEKLLSLDDGLHHE